MSSKPEKTAPDMAVMVKGQYDYGFTILPNVLRDELMPLAGTDAFSLAYIILSWGGKGERGASLSSRYLTARTRWSTSRTKNAKKDLLAAWPQVFTMVEGDQATSRPETWWVDFDALTELHSKYLLRVKEEQGKKRGPGRPKKPAAISEAGISEGTENPASGINTGFSNFEGFDPKTLLRKSQHPCFGNRSTPASGIAALKEKSQSPSERKVVVEDPSTETKLTPAPQQGDHQGQHNNNFSQAEPEQPQPPVGGSADADITDEELDLLFGSGTGDEVKSEDTDSENVPAAPAAAEAVPVAPFVPTPESSLEVGKLLAAKLGGKARLATMLAEPGRDNVRQKASWLGLEPAKVQAILEDAKAKCAEEGATFVTAITRRLDSALGARDLTKPAAPGTSATPGTLGSAYEVKPSVVVAEITGQALEDEPQDAPCKFVAGAVWQDKAGQLVTIEALEGGRYRLSNGQKLLAFELTRTYTFGNGAA